jgi:hypothetical protein
LHFEFLYTFAQSLKLDVSPYFRRRLIVGADAFQAGCRSCQVKQSVSVRPGVSRSPTGVCPTVDRVLD